MDNLIYIIKSTVLLFITALDFAFLMRAILSWFLTEEDNGFLFFLVAVTEPLITPVRALCDLFGWFEDIPLDIPFIITYMLLSVVGVLLTL